VRDQDWGAANAAKQKYHQVNVRQNLTEFENQGLRAAVQANKRKKKKRKVLPLQPCNANDGGGATLYSPSRIEQAREELREKEQQELVEEARKANEREIRHQQKLLEAKQKELDKIEKDRIAKERADAKAQERREIDARKADRIRTGELRDAQKVSKLPKQTKQKALRNPQSRILKGDGGATRRRPQVVHEPSSEPQGVKTQFGRTTRPTDKLRQPKVS
jgi:hypothetical protein